MRGEQIKKAIEGVKKKMAEAADLQEMLKLKLRQIRERCPHADVESWTNDDGDGSFKVERCRVCGLQRDGGLKKGAGE